VSSTIIQGVLTVAAGQQTSGVQVVEWVALVGSVFQFLLGLAAVSAITSQINPLSQECSHRPCRVDLDNTDKVDRARCQPR